MTTDADFPVTDWRNGIEILAESACWEYLGQAPVGRLAVSINNHPDIFPVNHVVADGAVVFRTAEGTKLAAAVLGAGVAFEVDGYDPESGDAWSVVVKGRAEEIEALDDLLAAHELPLFPWNAAMKHRFVRIVTEEITGRRFHVVEGAQGFR
jgi:uncharacterized protein